MIFHIPKQRIKGGPMIYPEYRLHSIVFALRSVVCYYLTYHGLPKIYNIGVCFVTMGLADITTYMYPSGTTTMRQMPFDSARTPERGVSEAGSEALATQSVGVRGFACALATAKGVSRWRLGTPTGLSRDGLPLKDNGIEETKRKYIIMIQSFHQIGATLYMVGNEDACFSPMFAIQLAALLMTLVRKNIISANEWHLIYNVSLGINIFVYQSLSIQYIGWHIGLVHLFFYWRFYLSRDTVNKECLEIKNVIGNKYIGWTIVFLLYLSFCENSPTKLLTSFLQEYRNIQSTDTIFSEQRIRYLVIFIYCLNHFYGVILPFILKERKGS